MRLGLMLLTGVLLSGCATEAYRAVEHECTPAALADYPENNIQILETRQRMVNVSTGMRNCYTSKDGNQTNTICHTLTRPELMIYQEAVVIDQNQSVRRRAIESCAANLCLQRYGNLACKTDQILVPVPVSSP